MDDCAILGIADRALTAMEETGDDASDLRRELAFVVAESCPNCKLTVVCERGGDMSDRGREVNLFVYHYSLT